MRGPLFSLRAEARIDEGFDDTTGDLSGLINNPSAGGIVERDENFSHSLTAALNDAV